MGKLMGGGDACATGAGLLIAGRAIGGFGNAVGRFGRSPVSLRAWPGLARRSGGGAATVVGVVVAAAVEAGVVARGRLEIESRLRPSLRGGWSGESTRGLGVLLCAMAGRVGLESGAGRAMSS